MTETDREWYVIEERQRFSESLLWDLQHRYFTEMGVEAWRQGEVPHYVTSNLTVANSYAEIVVALYRDQSHLVSSDQPLTICELGAGSGRFAFHFLTRLIELCDRAGLEPTSFRYVLTDVAENNLEFWWCHPRFQAFFEAGLLDIACFDVGHDDQLVLECSGETIGADTLERPMVLVANYVFDTVRQDLFYFDDGKCHDSLVTLFVDQDPEPLGIGELLDSLHLRHETEPLDGPAYAEPYLQALIEEYQAALSEMHLLVPATAIRCLQRVRAFSRCGILVLSADTGEHELSSLLPAPPILDHHGSFSLTVNYHAFKAFCEQQGGIAMFPRHHNYISVNGLLMVEEAAGYVETQNAYRQYIHDFSPDDFYTITRHAHRYVADMGVKDVLAYLRLSRYDSHQFARYLPRLQELGPEVSSDERKSVVDAIEKVWQAYFPLGEESDLAHEIALLLYATNDLRGALTYFERSIEIYEADSATLYNMGVCHHLLEEDEQAAPLLRGSLDHDPENHEAAALLAEITSA